MECIKKTQSSNRIQVNSEFITQKLARVNLKYIRNREQGKELSKTFFLL